MKLNKEILTKQRFWFCLGGFVLVWLIGFIVVKASAGPKVTDAKKAYDGATGKLNVPDPKSPAFMQPWDDAAKFYSGEVAVVWRDAWVRQKDLSIWPQASDAPFATWWNTSATWKEWHDKATGKESNDACDAYKRGLYSKQFITLLNELNSNEDYALLLDKGEINNAKIGPVEFKNGLHGYKVVMLPALASGAGPEGGRMAAPADRAGGPGTAHNVDNVFAKRPTVEECWYAQEDFWLKREILRTVKRTVDSVAKFTREEPGFWTSVTQRIEYPDRVFSPLADPKEKPEGKELIRQRFRNPNWELDLFFVEEKGEEGKVFYAVTNPSSIRNVSGRSQALSRPPTKDPKTGKEISRGYLEFTILQGEGKFKLEIQGDDLAAGKEAKIRAKDPKVVLTSGRTTFDPRKPFEVVQVFDWYTAPIRRIEEIRTCVHSHRTANIPLKPHKELYKPEPPPAAAPPPAGTNPPPAAAAPPANAPAPKTEANGLERNRYLNATDTTRDLPFAVVLVMEQPHIADFEVELANSRVRIQITQEEVRRLRNVAPAPPPPPEQATGTTTPPPMGQTPPNAPAEVKMDQNLVEVTIYGIAALYEKFNEKKEEKKP